MSAEDNELDYLHVPRNEIDAAIMQAESRVADVEGHDPGHAQASTAALVAIVKALRAIDRGKRSTW